MAPFGSKRPGFTLIELLMVIAIMAILSSIVFLALNPTRQLGLSRNRKRHNDITSILNALYQYAIDNNGVLPTSIPTGTAKQICMPSAVNCNNGVDLSVLSQTGTYLVHIPSDPQASTTGTGTNYWIMRDGSRRLTITAPGAEQNEVVAATK